MKNEDKWTNTTIKWFLNMLTINSIIILIITLSKLLLCLIHIVFFVIKMIQLCNKKKEIPVGPKLVQIIDFKRKLNVWFLFFKVIS